MSNRTIFPQHFPFQSYKFILAYNFEINNDFLKHKQANINVNSRRFGVIVTLFDDAETSAINVNNFVDRKGKAT